jgi:hypothetical protein
MQHPASQTLPFPNADHLTENSMKHFTHPKYKVFFPKDIPELGITHGDTGEMISNVKMAYLIRLKNGREEWLMAHAFQFVDEKTNRERMNHFYLVGLAWAVAVMIAFVYYFKI